MSGPEEYGGSRREEDEGKESGAVEEDKDGVIGGREESLVKSRGSRGPGRDNCS